jgi:hypothetical protein
LFPEAGHRDHGVRHVLRRLSQHAQLRTVTQQTPLHSLTRCITPLPAAHVLNAYVAEEDSPPPVQFVSAVSSTGGLSPTSGGGPPGGGSSDYHQAFAAQRILSHTSGRSGGLGGRNMPSSASEVFGQQNTMFRPRTVLDFWRESDSYINQISTEGSSHVGSKADSWRHTRAAAEAKWGWGDLSALEEDNAAQQLASARKAVTAQPRAKPHMSSSSSSSGTGERSLPHDNFAADLSGLCLTSIAQVSLALTSFAEGCARGFEQQVGGGQAVSLPYAA